MSLLLRRRGLSWSEIDSCTCTHFMLELMVAYDPDYAPKGASQSQIITRDQTDYDMASFWD